MHEESLKTGSSFTSTKLTSLNIDYALLSRRLKQHNNMQSIDKITQLNRLSYEAQL